MLHRLNPWRLSRALWRGVAMAALCAALGCGTIITTIDGPVSWEGEEISPIYSGTRFSWGGVKQSPLPVIWVIDLPLSLAGDTGALPIDILQVGATAILGLGEEEEEVLEPEATVVPPELQ